ncbi:hypothetical protein ADL27_32565 [Streptomyces sp. NRRL F-6602]|nr:hypothetical protein ADL27_32565 [Streptomyces sp. NRRL F-6602]
MNGNTMIYLGSYKADTDPEKRTAQRDALFAEKGITVLSEWTPVQAAWWSVDLDIPEGLVPKR